ncbi:hypothetical protein SAMN05421824_0888 [Hyunsoonleella jejuensis]|uniref:Uncharacterized protein n=1 Tax=Hyunsoonleella jejuensis TaxID=419940 RepID=A0A1H9CEG8_9FLAO|nr:hypothetical protein SAMN05421824_0888 [Hyunsoonleella jejuensis]
MLRRNEITKITTTFIVEKHIILTQKRKEALLC